MAVILLVEDDTLTLDVAAMMMREWGHQTLAAGDVEEALVILRSSQHIDALFTDIYLKGEPNGGCDIARQAMELRPALRVLYATGNSLTAKLKTMFVEGSDCLCKPYTSNQLQHSLGVLLAA